MSDKHLITQCICLHAYYYLRFCRMRFVQAPVNLRKRELRNGSRRLDGHLTLNLAFPPLYQYTGGQERQTRTGLAH